MPVSIVYVGPSYEGVEIAETGQLALPGKPIEVEDSELAERLLEQDIWARPNTNAAADAARQAKSPRKSGTQQEDS